MAYVQNVDHLHSMDLEEKLGARIKAIRISRGLTQEVLAASAQITRSYLGELERGKFSAGINTLQYIAQCLNVTLSELVRGIDTDIP